MNRCHFTEEQKTMLQSIIPGLKNGTIKTEWTIMSASEGIFSIFGLDDDGTLWREIWAGVTYSDFEDFVQCGLFRVMTTDNYGLPSKFSLHKQRIIEMVETNFGKTLQQSASEVAVSKDPKAVFVVHGRNEPIRAAFFEFLRAIGLHPLEWDELVNRTGKGTPYIGEVLDTAFSEAQAIIVLMTPDDIAMLRVPFQHETDEPHEKNLTPQARPNVLFEAGMAMGRSPERTILVEIGKLRPFSDIFGRHTVRFDGTLQKRQQLVQRLENAGCPANLKDIDWRDVGDFNINEQLRIDEERHNVWGKSGNLWWLQGDLIATMHCLNLKTKHYIDDGLERCYFHANQLGMSDRDIVERLKKLRDEARRYSEQDWKRAKREEWIHKIQSILNDAGQVAQSKQSDFKPDP